MAENNTVPLGQAGTGAAVILGQDNASQQFNRNLGAYNQRQQQLQALEQQKAQQIAKSYRDNMLAASDGKLFAKQLGDLEQKHLKQGMDYRSQGFDIYNPNPNDPKQLQAAEQYQSDRRTIENLRNYRKGLETKFKTVNDAISKARAGEYKQADIDAMHNFINGTDLLEAYNGGADLPTVNKTFNTAEALKGIKAPTQQNKRVQNGIIIDTTAIDPRQAENTVLSTLGSAQGGQDYLMEITGGIPLSEVRSLPKTREEIRKRREADYNGIPQLREALAGQQIQKGNAAYNKWLDEEADRLYNARKNYDNVIADGVGRISQGIKTVDSRTPQMTPYQEQNLNLQKQRLALAREKQSSDGTKDDGVLYRRQWVDDMINGVPDSGEQLKSILKGTGGYNDREVDMMIRTEPNNPNTILFNIPPRTIITESNGEEKEKIEPRKVVRINRNDENADVQLNQLLNDLTGEKINVSKFKTNNASGKIKSNTPQPTSKSTPAPKTVPLTKIKELVGKKGYEGYSEKELVDYYKSQGYKIQ